MSLVLLIDEYDAPLNFNLQNKEVFSAINLQIRSFYTVIKQFEGKFRFIFVTGVSRFNKVALFSAGSSIADITYGSEFSSMFGYTEDEIKTYFGDHLRAAAASIFNVSYDEVTDIQISQIMDELRRHYDGYCFDKRHQPMSISHGLCFSFCLLTMITSSLTIGFRTAVSARWLAISFS